MRLFFICTVGFPKQYSCWHKRVCLCGWSGIICLYIRSVGGTTCTCQSLTNRKLLHSGLKRWHILLSFTTTHNKILLVSIALYQHVDIHCVCVLSKQYCLIVRRYSTHCIFSLSLYVISRLILSAAVKGGAPEQP